MEIFNTIDLTYNTYKATAFQEVVGGVFKANNTDEDDENERYTGQNQIFVEPQAFRSPSECEDQIKRWEFVGANNLDDIFWLNFIRINYLFIPNRDLISVEKRNKMHLVVSEKFVPLGLKMSAFWSLKSSGKRIV